MTRQLPDTRQRSFQLEVEPAALKPASQPSLEALRFRLPDLERLEFMGQPLRAYLKDRGLLLAVQLHKLLAEVDCSALEANYQPSGQPPLHPRAVLGLFVYGLIVGRTSLRELERLAQTDLEAMYLCHGLQPDHSTLGNYVLRHQVVLTDEYFLTLTASLLAKLGTRPGVTAADGTVAEAAASRFRIVKAEAVKEAAREAAAAAAQAPHDEDAQQRARDAAALALVAQERQAARKPSQGDACLATTEPDAVVQPRKDGVYRPSYKPVVLANADRMIVGQDLQPSNENDALPKLLGQHNRVLGADPTTLMLDAGFFVAAVMWLCFVRSQDVLVAYGRDGKDGITRKMRDAVPKDDFRFDHDTDTFTCPQGRLLVLEGVSNGKEPYRRYRCHDCEGCPRRSECTDDPNGRTIKRYPEDDLKQAARQVMQHPQARKAYRQRKAIVEPVFSELKGRQGMTRFRRKGRAKVAAEFALHCIAYNLKRAVLLLARNEAGKGRSCPNPAPGPRMVLAAHSPVECARADMGMLPAVAANDTPVVPAHTDDMGLRAA